MVVQEVAFEDWKQILIGLLEFKPSARVADIVAGPNSTYHDIVRGLRVTEGETAKSAVQRYWTTDKDTPSAQEYQ